MNEQLTEKERKHLEGKIAEYPDSYIGFTNKMLFKEVFDYIEKIISERVALAKQEAVVTREKFNEMCLRADKKMKKTNGHSWLMILKTKCIYCGASDKVKYRCRNYMETFIDKLYEELTLGGGKAE